MYYCTVHSIPRYAQYSYNMQHTRSDSHQFENLLLRTRGLPSADENLTQFATKKNQPQGISDLIGISTQKMRIKPNIGNSHSTLFDRLFHKTTRPGWYSGCEESSGYEAGPWTR